jgi:hypothetical protein
VRALAGRGRDCADCPSVVGGLVAPGEVCAEAALVVAKASSAPPTAEMMTVVAGVILAPELLTSPTLAYRRAAVNVCEPLVAKRCCEVLGRLPAVA